jgi:uncharacterized protein (TIGR03067 family)
MRNCQVALLWVFAFAVPGAVADDKADLEKELKKFQGAWTLESSETAGQKISAEQLKGFIVTFEGNKHTLKMGDQVHQVGTQKIDPSKSPKTIDVTMTEGPSKGKVMLGIYEFDGDMLRVCFDPEGKKRPTEFKSPAGSKNFVNVHKRVKEASSAPEAKLYTPQPEHELLKRFDGAWRFERLSAAAPGATPDKLGAGEIKAELIGGFFVVCRWSGNVYGADYSAVQTLGYDVEKKAYSGIWIDNSMSYQWPLDGSWEADKKELVIAASGPGPTGGICKFRERYKFQSADSITVVADMLQKEKWVTFMTTHITRKK